MIKYGAMYPPLIFVYAQYYRNRGKVGRLTGRGMLFMVLLSLYFGFTSTGVDNMAHVGGLICGFLTAVLLYHGRKVPRQEV